MRKKIGPYVKIIVAMYDIMYNIGNERYYVCTI